MDRPPIQEPSGFVAGVWANDVDVFWSRHEFTIDFFRFELRGDEQPERGAAVARVALSPALVVQLRDRIEDARQEYEAWTSHSDLQ